MEPIDKNEETSKKQTVSLNIYGLPVKQRTAFIATAVLMIVIITVILVVMVQQFLDVDVTIMAPGEWGTGFSKEEIAEIG